MHRVLGLMLALATEAPAASPALDSTGFERIDLGHGEIAWVSTPAGAREPRPVIVGIHGAGDRADWACNAKQATADHAVVICPQSKIAAQWKDTFVWGSAASIEAQANRAVAAARAKYGAWMQDGPMIYGGWSFGGTLASEAIAIHPGTYDRVVLVEVGHTALDADQVSARLLAAGVKRTVVACESPNCRSFAERFDVAARKRHLPARSADAGFRQHWFDEPVYRALAPRLVWLVDDDPRYVGMAAAIEARWATD